MLWAPQHHVVDKPQVRAGGKEVRLMLSGKPESEMMLDPPNNNWNPVVFLVLVRESKVHRGIHTDDPPGC